MAIIKFDNLGQVGFISDLPAYNLPPNVWSNCENVDYEDLVVKKGFGYLSSNAIGTPSATPYFAFAGRDAVNFSNYLIYAGQQKVYAIINGTHSNITRTNGAGADVNYSASTKNAWNAGELNGILVLNNGTDQPQKWTAAASSVRLQNLDGWTSTWKAAVIRPYRNFLIALDVTKASIRFPQMVKWSTSASLGNIPLSWDETDATKDAGEIALAETLDYCIDCEQLRDINVIYKEKSVWGQQFIGFPLVFRFFKMFGSFGIMAKNCVVEYNDTHFVITKDDIIRHDGQSYGSIIDNRLKREIFSNLNRTHQTSTFAVVNKFNNRLICAFPFNSEYPDNLYEYNILEDSWTHKVVAPINHLAINFGIQSGEDWSSAASLTWETDLGNWGGDVEESQKMVGPSSANNKLYSVFDGLTSDGQNRTVFVERKGMSYVSPAFETADNKIKLIRFVRPDISASSSVNINIYIGTQENYNDAVNWGTPVNYNPLESKEAWFLKLARYYSIRFESMSGSIWELKSYSINLEITGDYA